MDSSQSETLWIDGIGRTWSTAITVNTIKRVQQLTGVNLTTVFDGKLLNQLATDPILLVNTLWAVCQPQAEQRHVSEDQFAELLVGDTIEQAAEALVRGMICFFPKDRREVLGRLWQATNQTQTAAYQMVATKLDDPQVQATIQAAMDRASQRIDQELETLRVGSGNWPASSE